MSTWREARCCGCGASRDRTLAFRYWRTQQRAQENSSLSRNLCVPLRMVWYCCIGGALFGHCSVEIATPDRGPDPAQLQNADFLHDGRRPEGLVPPARAALCTPASHRVRQCIAAQRRREDRSRGCAIAAALSPRTAGAGGATPNLMPRDVIAATVFSAPPGHGSPRFVGTARASLTASCAGARSACWPGTAPAGARPSSQSQADQWRSAPDAGQLTGRTCRRRRPRCR
jgi:hypothetical protein